MLILVGLVAGLILKFATDKEMLVSFDSSTFFLYLLPPIVLDAGWCMPPRHFFENFGLILAFAIFGTIINSFGIGFGLHYLIEAGAITGPDGTALEIDKEGCLLFGSLNCCCGPCSCTGCL